MNLTLWSGRLLSPKVADSVLAPALSQRAGSPGGCPGPRRVRCEDENMCRCRARPSADHLGDRRSDVRLPRGCRAQRRGYDDPATALARAEPARAPGDAGRGGGGAGAGRARRGCRRRRRPGDRDAADAEHAVSHRERHEDVRGRDGAASRGTGEARAGRSDRTIARPCDRRAPDIRRLLDRPHHVRQLLDHTSGMFDYATSAAYDELNTADPGRHWTADRPAPVRGRTR